MDGGLLSVVRKGVRERRQDRAHNKGEFFFGNPGVPPDVDLQLFKTNVKKVWQQAIAAAPKDAAGDRINTVQVNPITFGRDVTVDDIAAIGIGASIGASDRDPYLFTNNGGLPDGSLCDRDSRERARHELYGRVPLASQCDGHTFEAGELQTWSGIADPFGFKQGQNLRIKLEYVISYFGSKGGVQENTITVKDNAALTGDGFPAFDRFGPAERMRPPSGARCITTRLTSGLLQFVDDAPSSETTDALTDAGSLPSGSGGLLLVVASVDGNPTIATFRGCCVIAPGAAELCRHDEADSVLQIRRRLRFSIHLHYDRREKS